ncbi:hypothetical protein C8Q78DRAFT_1036475, partial [Trametes maxima]
MGKNRRGGFVGMGPCQSRPVPGRSRLPKPKRAQLPHPTSNPGTSQSGRSPTPLDASPVFPAASRLPPAAPGLPMPIPARRRHSFMHL